MKTTIKTGLILLFAVGLLGGLLGGCKDEGNDSEEGNNDTPPCDIAWGAHSEETGLCWQNPSAPASLLLETALEYCDALDLGGHTDWTLPSRNDFMSMLGGCEVSFDLNTGGFCDSCKKSEDCMALFADDKEAYWTSSSQGDDGDDYWEVDLEFGEFAPLDKEFANDVRCVRIVN